MRLTLGGVSGDEVVGSLLGSELRDGRQNTVGITGEEDEVCERKGIVRRKLARRRRYATKRENSLVGWFLESPPGLC